LFEFLNPLGFTSEEREKYSSDDVLKLAGDNLQDLVRLCQKTGNFLGIKGSKRCHINELLVHMKDVHEFMSDKHESSTRRAARTTLALCPARNPELSWSFVLPESHRVPRLPPFFENFMVGTVGWLP
jgi:hypothetical protein